MIILVPEILTRLWDQAMHCMFSSTLYLALFADGPSMYSCIVHLMS